MPFAAVNGIDLYYQALGSGPPLVFAHGAGGNHLSWWQQMPHFSRRHRCVAFDHRAFGRSLDEPDGPGRRAFADDLNHLLDLLAIDKTAIIAQSMGGRTAVGFAYRNPDRVSALVFAGTTAGAVDEALREAQEAYRQTPSGRRPLAARAVSPRLRAEQPQLDYLYRAIRRLNPARPKEFLAPIPGYRGSSAELLAGLGVPILFLVGSDDAVTPPQFIRRSHELVAGSQFDVIDGAGHSAYFEQPGAFNQRVSRFLEEAGWV
jgi:pimeloyl-ACP methyl ester carboxylesterase